MDDQFASNMWTCAISTPTRITTYYLGYRQVRGLFDEVKAASGEELRLQDFMDGMMELGPVPWPAIGNVCSAAQAGDGSPEGRGRATRTFAPSTEIG